MIINSIKISNFKSIKSLELDFTDVHGLYGVSGLVGAGKTTLSEAILFGLFGSVRNKNNRDLIRWGEKSCRVEVDLLSRTNNIKLTRTIRGAASTLDVLVNDEPIIFTNKKDAQKQLENEYYDTNRLIIETLFIISFNNFKSISSMSSQDMKEFLDKILNLHIITEYSSTCKNVVKDLQVNQKVEEANINALKKQIETFNKLRDEIVVSDNDYLAMTSKLESFQAKKRQYEEGRVKKLNSIQESITEKNTQIRYKEKCSMDIRKNIDFINKKVCPTCGAPIDDSNLHDFVLEYTKISSEIEDIKQNLKQLQTKYSDVKNNADKAIADIDTEINNIVVEITKYKQHKKQIETYNKTIQEIHESLADATEKCKQTNLDIEQYNELYDILNLTVRQSIINNAVPMINKNISYYSYKLGLPYNISFDSTFRCIISTPLQEGIPITSLSTGQMKTVDMVIILAILKVLLGSFNMNIIFLDELFSNLDNELRDVMCEILKDELAELHSNGHPITAFLISHSPLNESMLSGRVYVDRSINNNESMYSIQKYK